eukprot:scaffold303951_cov28-Tisochrysis_lutea.AAC.1
MHAYSLQPTAFRRAGLHQTTTTLRRLDDRASGVASRRLCYRPTAATRPPPSGSRLSTLDEPSPTRWRRVAGGEALCSGPVNRNPFAEQRERENVSRWLWVTLICWKRRGSRVIRSSSRRSSLLTGGVRRTQCG